MYNPSANELGFTTGGTERVRIDSSGYVGIGTNNPTSTLQLGHTGTTTDTSLHVIAGNSKTATIAAYGNNAGTARLYLGEGSTYGGGIVFNGDDSPNISSTTNAVSFYRRYNGTDTEVFYYYYNSSTVYFSVININEIHGSSGGATDPTYTFSTNTNTGMFLPSSGELGFTNNGTERVRINSSGYVGIGTNNPLTSLSITPTTGGAKITLWDGGDSTDHYGFGIVNYQLNYDVGNTSSSHVFYAGGKNGTGTELMRIKGNGKVGIGTNNPTEKLDVNGNARVDGVLLLEAGTHNSGADSVNRTNTYIAFGEAGADTDYALLRQVGGDNLIHLALDFHDDGNETGFSIRDVRSTASPDSITTRFMVKRGGYVGIGTYDPLRTLHVNGQTYISSGGLLINSALTGNRPSVSAGTTQRSHEIRGFTNDISLDYGFLRLRVGGGTNQTSTTYIDLSGYSDKSDMNKNIVFGTSGSEKVRIDSSGDVGIGTNNPSYKLDVWSAEDSVWNARIYNYTTGSDDDCKMVVQTASTGGEAHYTLMTPDILWHMVTGAGASGESLEFKYDDNPGSSPNYNSGTLAGYITKKSDNASLNFTGQHRTFIKDIPFSEASSLEGLIVSANTDEYIKMSGGIEYGNNAITINESLPLVNLSSIQNDKACFGVISLSEDPDTREDKYGTYVAVIKKEEGDTRVYINSVGEGAMWVINSNGNIESGDYITTSSVKGYGMKQDSEFLANYTVAKITMNCDFNPQMVNKKQIIKHLGTRKYYYKELNIEKGEYDTLPEKYRRTEEVNITQEEYDNMNEMEQSQYTDLSKIVYKALKFSKTLKEGYKTIEIEEMLNTLDEHGQIQWEDTEELEPKYNTRYVDTSGEIITEEQYNSNISNNIPSYKAAFVGCTYHCG
jgi:hypothetical protein